MSIKFIVNSCSYCVFECTCTMSCMYAIGTRYAREIGSNLGNSGTNNPIYNMLTTYRGEKVEALFLQMELAIEPSPVRSPSPLGATPNASTFDKLPPISPPLGSGGAGGGRSDSSGGEEGERICTALMQNASTELKDSMGHLLNEVSYCQMHK